ncbi:hypothetical protein I546_1760 [Mycobacterium kansasii 732]|nr:hypothetical protein I546_1760 [Mycobacterium kansasii 732]
MTKTTVWVAIATISALTSAFGKSTALCQGSVTAKRVGTSVILDTASDTKT